MAELNESSGLLSLAALREQEKRRNQLQAEAARARAEAEQRARLEVEREAARLEQARQRAERAALQLAESEQHAEQVRSEAGLRAEFERAEALVRACDELKLAVHGEREGRRRVELDFTSQLLRQRLRTTLSALLCVGTWLAAAALYFGALRPAAERAQIAAEQSRFSAQRAQREASADRVRAAQQNQELAEQVGSLEQTLRAERALKNSSPPVAVNGPIRPALHPLISTMAPRPCRDDGDPLNPCLKR